MAMLDFLSSRSAARRPAFAQLNIVPLGRSNAGKTASLIALFATTIEQRLPSGLLLSAGDPRKVNELRNENKLARRDLRDGKLPSTLVERTFRFGLSRGPVRYADVTLGEQVGQVLTGVTSASPQDEQQRFDQVAKRLSQADVIHVTLPVLPARPTAADRTRFRDDLAILGCWLNQTLLDHGDQPVSVAILLTKLDAAFSSLDDARDGLTSDLLFSQIEPLIRTVEAFDVVREAALFPVTAFGMGNSIATPPAGSGLPPADVEDVPETNFQLDRAASLEPFNYDAVMIWSLIAGLLQQPPTEESVGPIEQAITALTEDLARANPWLLPIRGYLAQLA